MKNNNNMKDLIEGLNNYLNEAITPQPAALVQTYNNLIKKDIEVAGKALLILKNLVTDEKILNLTTYHIKALAGVDGITLIDAVDNVVSFIEDLERDVSKVKNSLSNVSATLAKANLDLAPSYDTPDDAVKDYEDNSGNSGTGDTQAEVEE